LTLIQLKRHFSGSRLRRLFNFDLFNFFLFVIRKFLLFVSYITQVVTCKFFDTLKVNFTSFNIAVKLAFTKRWVRSLDVGVLLTIVDFFIVVLFTSLVSVLLYVNVSRRLVVQDLAFKLRSRYLLILANLRKIDHFVVL